MYLDREPRVLQRAGNGTRTRDPNLGKVVLYQLSYSRIDAVIARKPTRRADVAVVAPFRALRRAGCRSRHGGEGNRTPDLLNAIQALSQLSYAPASQRQSVGSRRQPPGTPDNSRVYTQCQRIGTGENLVGRYFAAPSVTRSGWSVRCRRRSCRAPVDSRSDADIRVRRSIDADSNAPRARGQTAT